MITKERFRQVASMLDPDIYPETINYLKQCPDTEHLSLHALTAELENLDNNRNILTPELFDLFVELYEEMIKEEEDNIYAINNLGALYYGGRGCHQDFAKAVYYFTMAAEHGCRQSLANLGYCYYYGRSGPVDYEKAFHYFALGAFEGNAESLYKIGDMYKNGYYVRKDLEQAFIIYAHCRDIVESHHEFYDNSAGPVYLRLGTAYLNGEGTGRDLIYALKYFQKAEFYLYNMVESGLIMYKKSLKAAIEGQEKARQELMKNLPPENWPHE